MKFICKVAVLTIFFVPSVVDYNHRFAACASQEAGPLKMGATAARSELKVVKNRTVSEK